MNRFSPRPDRALAFLRTCPSYKESPLHKIKSQAGVDIFIKDETDRMGLGAFKGLGGVYAVAALIREKWEQKTGDQLDFQQRSEAQLLSFTRALTFICASAGNHGLAVAEGAKMFGSKAIVYLSNQVPVEFENKLLSAGANVIRQGETYEESCAAAKAHNDQTDAILLADASWEGYTHAPALVMEGYTVLAEELRSEFETTNSWPTHVYLQAGVGGLAAAITYMIRANWREQPKIFIVEPEAAQCLRQSNFAGRPTHADGPASNMGRLDCKEPSIIAFETLQTADVHYLTISDQQATQAVDYLHTRNFQTTPSGAAGFAGFLQSEQHDNLTANDRALIIMTETAART